MDAPVGDWSNATIRACFELVSSCFVSLTATGLDDFEAFVRFPFELGERFLDDFGIGNPFG
jgi:hypothetical protein